MTKTQLIIAEITGILIVGTFIATILYIFI